MKEVFLVMVRYIERFSEGYKFSFGCEWKWSIHDFQIAYHSHVFLHPVDTVYCGQIVVLAEIAPTRKHGIRKTIDCLEGI